uniref:Serpentine Receptor, class T n=1 Tax=Panagrellus redivivus TaxID=6233 RepID=A0A7E4VCZ1_PANRE
MEAFFFDEAKYQLLYNCSFYDYDSIPAESRAHPIVGSIFVATAVFFIIIYIPCLLVFLHKEYRQQPCYQLMFILGINDIALLLFSGVLTGIYGIFGTVYCQYPKTIYFLGSGGVSLWCAQCITLVILALNRCLEMGNRHWADILFGKGRVLHWMFLSIAYFNIVCWWTAPGIFNPFRMAWLFNPHDVYYADPEVRYYNGVQFYNNIAMIIVMTTIYSTFLYILYKRSSVTQNLKHAKLSFIQVFAICLATVIICLAYVIIQYVTLPVELGYLTQFIWICNSGFPAIIYLTLNPTLRHHVFMVVNRKRYLASHKSTITPAVTPSVF